MPITTTFEPNGIYQHLTGLIRPHDLRGWRKTVSSDPKWENASYLLNHCTDCVFSPEINLDVLREMAARDDAMHLRNPRVTWLLVAPEGQLPTLGRLHNYLKSRMVPFRVFPTLEEARRWIEENIRY